MGWLSCFEKALLAGTVFGGGATEKGTLREEDKQKAYAMGKNV